MKIKFFLKFLTISLFFSISVYSQTALIDTAFSVNVDSINSKAVDYKSVPGVLQLATGENENLALNRYAYITFAGVEPADTGFKNPLRLIDGNKSSPSFVSFPGENLGGRAGSYITIDLQAVRRVKNIMIYSLGSNPLLRIRAYTVYAGMDTTGIEMEKVFQEPDNTQAIASATFPAITARYVKIVLDFIATTNNTVISEIEVFGEGYLPEGIFYSSVRDIGRNVNFGSFHYEGEKPSETDVAFSVRTGNTPIIDSTWSSWSIESNINDALFEVFEPRRYLQYSLKLSTKSLETPKINQVKIYYDTSNVASVTDAFISPQYVQILKDQEFRLSVDLKFNPEDLGVDTLYIYTPSPTELNSVSINNAAASVQSRVTAGMITLVFNTTIKSDSKVDVTFRTTPFLDISPYKAIIASKQALHNPQRVDSKVSNQIDAWSIITIGVPEKLIIRSKVTPNPFSPNGDGINDVAKFEFYLGNIAQPSSIIGIQIRDLSVKIFDLNGRIIRTVYDKNTGADAFISDKGIDWDGRDDSGRIVRPGVYVYQIFINSDNGGEYYTSTVVVSY